LAAESIDLAVVDSLVKTTALAYIASQSGDTSMYFRQAIEIILRSYPDARAHYEPKGGWRILSAPEDEESSFPLGPYREDWEKAMIVAAENVA